MPELPEVETIRKGIFPHLINQRISSLTVRQRQLRWPIPSNLNKKLKGQIIHAIARRGKYLLIHTASGTIILHLGMSGHLRIVQHNEPIKKHDHIDFSLENGFLLRFNDARRFGSILWTSDQPHDHWLLRDLGPEPLEKQFNGNYLYQKAKSHRTSIKQFIMNGRIVVGVGNIYANEALFLAGIHPLQSANNISIERYTELSRFIKKILKDAIKSGGSTIRSFINSEGEPGYFVQQLNIYGRSGLPCKKCRVLLQEIRIGQRSSVFCPQCQQPS
jgi:formamidopyrimidine-DNA glycosylase